uniref:DnaJ homolog subfamily C member 5B n=1 Tax=Sus scrofa TaxID=9823 RepID=A0A8D0WGC2_PIG
KKIPNMKQRTFSSSEERVFNIFKLSKPTSNREIKKTYFKAAEGHKPDSNDSSPQHAEAFKSSSNGKTVKTELSQENTYGFYEFLILYLKESFEELNVTTSSLLGFYWASALFNIIALLTGCYSCCCIQCCYNTCCGIRNRPKVSLPSQGFFLNPHDGEMQIKTTMSQDMEFPIMLQ